MKKLSAVIIVKNEESNISRCLASVAWTDEIIVVDSGSTDATLEICKKFNCRIFITEWLGFGKTKQFAVSKASFDWILSIDADEEISPQLRDSIQHILSETPKFHGYRIKRKTFYLTRFIQYCGWNKDYPLRLFNRKHGHFNTKLVHESVEIDGKSGCLEEVILHYTYPDLSNHVQKIDLYTSLGARQDFDKGRRQNLATALFRGIYQFCKMYIFRRGFLDGMDGLILCLFSGFGSMLKYLKIMELGLKKKSGREK